MATVKEVSLCPRCQSELPKDQAQTKCPTCNFQFPYQTDVFGTPDYISSQYQTVLGQIQSEVKDADKKRWSLERAHMKFLVNMADVDRVFALKDAESILKYAMASNSTGTELKEIIEVGKRVGALADAMDKFIRLGGRPNGFFDTPQPRSGRPDPFNPGGEDGQPPI